MPGKFPCRLRCPKPRLGPVQKFLAIFFNNSFSLALQTRMLKCLLSCFMVAWVATRSLAGDSAPETPIFKDKNLESAVRKFVFAKRDNDKPIVEADVANLSTIQGVGMGIEDLSGLEKCVNLASLDLSTNKIKDLTAIQGLAKLQYLNLANNQVADLAPLANDLALQYIELSNNHVKDLKPLGGLTNLASLYLSNNRVGDVSPIVRLPRMASLYLDNNQIKNIAGVGGLGGLTALSLNHNAIADLAPLDGLTNLYFLFLENNKIRDLTPLLKMVKTDFEGEKQFAPFLHLYLKGNSIKGSQTTQLKACGVRLNE
jgi:internalin A